MTGYKTPAQRLEAAHTRIDKLADEVATLSRVLAAQNQATASIQREFRMWVRYAIEDSHSRGDRPLQVARHPLDLTSNGALNNTFSPMYRGTFFFWRTVSRKEVI